MVTVVVFCCCRHLLSYTIVAVCYYILLFLQSSLPLYLDKPQQSWFQTATIMGFFDFLSRWFGGRIPKGPKGVRHPLYVYKKGAEKRSGYNSFPSPAHSSMFNFHHKGDGAPEKTPTGKSI